MILSAPFATWWLVGDISEPHGYSRVFHPPALSRGVERAVGTAATTAVLAGLALCVIGLRSGALDRAVRLATTPLVVAGVLLGFGYRVVTCATVGANIGGGFVLLAAPLVLAPLVLRGVARWWRLSATGRSRWRQGEHDRERPVIQGDLEPLASSSVNWPEMTMSSR